jgi:hypothetical protein
MEALLISPNKGDNSQAWSINAAAVLGIFQIGLKAHAFAPKASTWR